ncbi:uncharacterized protein N7496_004400 [Penicillium cataractarum]|uniref:DUF4048 domain-containing protein n=1 Tax=Penicillium cataractarum TaxID=2100454 RepID=A0A9W9VHC5_9EURO|nr:uncharacterized protein N7496_004400 [Penicillium cataractarum]KAJ5381972.1 hypothetical protein N7496_004400 [Penicillium cataractarum]
MELSPGTGDALIHGPHPNASPTSMAAATTTTAEAVHASAQSTTTPEKPLSRSASLLQQKRSSLPPRAHAGARHAKRLTLNFPINIPLDQPPAAASDPSVSSPGSMTPVTQSSTRPSPALPAGTPMPFDVEDDGYDFLRAIASQERKVLELREELHRAETELSTLKKQWAQSEKTRKRTEINLHAEPLLPLRSPDLSTPEASNSHHREQSLSSVASSSVSQERVSRELERRSSVRVAPVAPPKGTTISANGRRVFQGSHTRTLSLLSPVTASSPLTAGANTSDSDRVGRTPRSATLPSVERETVSSIGSPMDESQVPEHVLAQWRKNMPPPSREALVRTGKQMASDLREGLWTFFEDIRQATVGEEGINATESRTMSPPNGSLAPSTARKRDSLAKSRSRDRLSATGTVSRSSSSSSSRGRGTAAEKTSGKDTKPADISTSFWHEFGVDSPAQTSPRPGAHRSPSDNTIAASTRRDKTESGPPDHHSSSQVETDDDTADNWDMWDTPLPASKITHTPSSSRSTVESSKHDQSPNTQGSSPRTSASFSEWNPSSAAPDPSVTEGIPWPTITKLAPSKLQRTASNLMAEWERSLSPSPSPERKDSPGFNRGKNDKKD